MFLYNSYDWFLKKVAGISFSESKFGQKSRPNKKIGLVLMNLSNIGF